MSIRTTYANYLIFGILSLATLWLSSGTLAPYAASHHQPLLDKECNYLFNLDHSHFEATYLFLNGAPPEQWDQSVVLRRILYPLIAYPFMRATDFLTGGFIASALLHLLCGVLFLRFIKELYGINTQRYCAVALATFPGIAYFGSLPYSYACIVPFSLIGFMCLSKLNDSSSIPRAAISYGLLLGMLNLGYDLFAFFLPTGLLLLSLRKAWFSAVLFAICSVIIPLTSTVLLEHVFNVPIVNSNTVSYGNIFGAYLSIFTRLRTDWLPLLAQLPYVFLHNFIFSTFLVLPVTVTMVSVYNLQQKRALFNRVETAFIVTGFLIWLFNNAAPPYEGWQLRGFWIARVYLPLFVPLLVFACRSIATITPPLRFYCLSALVLCQSLVVYGPFFGFDSLSDYLYAEFYQHSKHGAFSDNVQKHGRHLLGSCPARADLH